MQSDDSALTTAESREKTARIGADVNLAQIPNTTQIIIKKRDLAIICLICFLVHSYN